MRKVLFFLLIFFLPTQIGFHFWPSFSKVAGFKVDYLSPTIYIFDLLLLINLILSKSKNFLKLPKAIYLACIINLVYSKFSPPSLYGWFRIFEYSLFLKYLFSVPNLLLKTKLPLFCITFIIVFLTFTQFLSQHSIQGPFYFLGERYYDSTSAHLGRLNFQSSIFNFQLIRPFSLFPHANTLAGFFLLIILLSDRLRFSPIFKKLIVFSLFLTFSKTAIFTYFLVFIFNTSFLQNFLISLLLSILPLSFKLYPLNLSFSSLDTRYHILNTLTSFSLFDYLLGIGPKAFISKLPNIYPASNINSFTLQPLHNLPVLIFLEVGLLPILIVILNLVQDRSRNKFGMTKEMCNVFSIVLLTGSLDHYWWTIPQATLSFILTFVLLFRYGIRRSHNSH